MLSMPDKRVVDTLYNLSLSFGILNVIEALPSSNCFNTRNTIGPFCRKSHYHQEYFLYPALPAIGVKGAYKQAKRPVRLCRAKQVRHARLQHGLQ
jgi:hypothetical protein